MVSFIWRSTTGDEDANKLGQRASAGTDLIQFDLGNVSDGKHIHQTELGMTIGIGENEKPKGNINELQDTFLDGIEWTITGSVEGASNTSLQKVKEWLIEAKTDAVFTKGRFGLELDSADITDYNLIPSGTGASPEQPRGYIITNWRWIRAGAQPGRIDFIAILRFNGELGIAGTSPPYDWTVKHA